jgi:Tfp pilus assembly PilM family ATPase/Tfp pilus assembly protein PilN
MAIQGLNFLSKKNDQDLVGFELNADELRIVHVRLTQLKREVAHAVNLEVHGLSDDDIASRLRGALTQMGLKNPRAFLMVPMNAVITRTIEIPSRDPVEIREIVSLQASRHTPYSRSEIIIDTLNLGVVRENYTKVLLVIVPKEVVVRQLAILEKAGLKVKKVFFPPEGIGSACTKILNAENSDTVHGIVHMDTHFTEFIVIQRGKVLFVRGITIGAANLLDEKEIYNDRFIDELQKSLESYVADELGPMPSTLLLTGVVAESTELDELFNETLRIPLKHQTYFNHFSMSGAARQTAAGLTRASFFGLIAPLLLFDRMRIDLVSEEQKMQIQLERRGREMVKTGVLVMLLLSLVFAGFVSKIYFKKAYLSKLQKRYGPIREEAKQLEQMFTKTQVVKEYLATRGDSIATLSELYETLPEDIRLTDIKYDAGDKFSVRGTSSTMASVFAFVTSMEKSEKFKSVKTKYVTARNEEGKDVADFEIMSVIEQKGTVPA